MSQSAREAIAAFHAACGITARLAETPVDRFAEVVLAPAAPPPREAPARSRAPAAPRRPAEAPARAAPQAPQGLDIPAPREIMEAREMARAAPTLEALHAVVAAFEGCPLKATARQACHGEGPIGAPVMFVGEAPGREEDEAGRPFVGRSGKLLDKMVAAIGLAREDVYITNIIPWRPPGNRTPSPIETATCEVFVRREIALVRPKILVPLGGPSAKTLLRNDAGIMRQRGHWARYEDEDGLAIDAMAMFHPAYLLRTPAEKRRSWQDLLAVANRLGTVRRHTPG